MYSVDNKCYGSVKVSRDIIAEYQDVTTIC